MPEGTTAGIDAAAARDGIVLDAAQRDLRDRLTVLGADLRRPRVRQSAPRSLYIHGGAGRGKSWLADAFYNALPTRRKTRVHFHGFFDELHRSIHRHRGDGAGNAVERAIDDVTGTSRLLFFDELHVHDSGDARLLTRLLDHVFQRKLTVLATSNYAPEDLLPNPIWHPIFEPGIQLIKTNMDVYHLDGPVDYRIGRTEHSAGFAAGRWMTSPPAMLPQPAETIAVSVRDRQFAVLAARPGELWVTFDQLCGSPTSTIEYREWSRVFPRWVIIDIPEFEDADAQAQQRFINVIDVLVDDDVSVDFISEHPLTSFLAGASQRPDAFRMASRLHLLR